MTKTHIDMRDAAWTDPFFARFLLIWYETLRDKEVGGHEAEIGLYRDMVNPRGPTGLTNTAAGGGVMSTPEKIRSVIQLASAYYVENPAGGHLHIVLDDANSERCHVEWCRDLAARNGDEAGVTLADELLDLNEDEREKLCKEYEYGGIS